MEANSFEGFILREVAGKNNLLNLNSTDQPYVKPLRLNKTGALIWKQITEGKTMDDIAMFLSENYEIPMETAKMDTQSFVSELKKFGVPLTE